MLAQALQAGDGAPDFELPNRPGEPVRLGDALARVNPGHRVRLEPEAALARVRSRLFH